MKINQFFASAVFILSMSVSLIACKKTIDNGSFIPASDYVNIAKGKYITYKLDSTVTINFGTAFKTVSYTIKDSVVDAFLDNSGRETFKIFRYQLNTTNGRWIPINTFTLNDLGAKIEYVQNNLRYTSLVSPVVEGREWKGNSYISVSPFKPDNFFNSWTYKYKNVGAAKTYGALSFPNTVTVEQFDSTTNLPFYNKAFWTYDKGYELYAKNIGLVYRDIMSLEYQVFTSLSNCSYTRPKATGAGLDTIRVNCNLATSNCDSIRRLSTHKLTCDTSIINFEYKGYGIKQVILDHN